MEFFFLRDLPKRSLRSPMATLGCRNLPRLKVIAEWLIIIQEEWPTFISEIFFVTSMLLSAELPDVLSGGCDRDTLNIELLRIIYATSSPTPHKKAHDNTSPSQAPYFPPLSTSSQNLTLLYPRSSYPFLFTSRMVSRMMRLRVTCTFPFSFTTTRVR